MRIYIIGAPDTGKQELAYKVKEKAPHMEVFAVPVQSLNAPALGALADYRTEVTLAVDRMKTSLNRDNTIATSSLVDSVAHIAVNYVSKIEGDYSILDDEELMTTHAAAFTVAGMLRDSLKADFFFFMPGFNDDYGELIETSLRSVMEEFNVSYVELSDDLEENANLIADVIHGRDVGSSDDI